MIQTVQSNQIVLYSYWKVKNLVEIMVSSKWIHESVFSFMYEYPLLMWIKLRERWMFTVYSGERFCTIASIARIYIFIYVENKDKLCKSKFHLTNRTNWSKNICVKQNTLKCHIILTLTFVFFILCPMISGSIGQSVS